MLFKYAASGSQLRNDDGDGGCDYDDSALGYSLLEGILLPMYWVPWFCCLGLSFSVTTVQVLGKLFKCIFTS